MAGRDHIPANLRHRSHHHSPLDQRRRGLPAPELRLIEDQSLEIQTLIHDNQRLAASHRALKQDVAATEQDVRLLSATADSVKAEREAQVREFYDRTFKLEAEVRSIEGIPAELDRVRADIKDLRADREEMLGKLKDIDGDFKRTHLELEQLAALKGEIEAMHKEIRRGRAAVDYERKLHAKNSEMSEAMEKHMASLSQESQKLRSELADAEKRAMAAAAAAVTAYSADPGYGYGYGYAMHPGGPNHVYGGNSISDPYAVHQGSIEAHFQYGVGVAPHGPPGVGVGPHGPPVVGVGPHGPPGVGVGPNGPPGVGVGPHGPPGVGVEPNGPPGVRVGHHGPPGVGVGPHGPPGAYVVQGQHLHN